MSFPRNRAVVIKLGGSVLVNETSYGDAARFLVRRLQTRNLKSEAVPGEGSPERNDERLVVVVSARKGITDELERLARDTTRDPNPRTLDLLWSTGEIHSVALLTLHLEELGVSAIGLNIHETGLHVNGTQEVGFSRTAIEEALKDHAVVVVPEFFCTNHGDAIRSLGRGGSDLSAVLLANSLEASRCELIKDVAGYFDEDPHSHTNAVHLPQLSYERALKMANNGCDLIQRRALEAARSVRLRLMVCTMDDSASASVVSEDAVDP